MYVAFLVTKISVDVDSKQLVKLLFPDKTRHTDAVGVTTVQITILLQKFWIAMHRNKHAQLIRKSNLLC